MSTIRARPGGESPARMNPERTETPAREFRTTSGIELEPVYGAAELPGRYPFTRGVRPTMYRGQLWTMRQYAGFASAEESTPA